MNKTYSKTEDGKLKVIEPVEVIREFTYEELEQQLAHCEQQVLILGEHIKLYKDLIKEADKLGVLKQIP